MLHLEQGGRRLSTNLKLRGSITLRISQRLCGRNSESIPQSKTGHCEIQVRPLRVGTEQNKGGAGSGPRLKPVNIDPKGNAAAARRGAPCAHHVDDSQTRAGVEV